MRIIKKKIISWSYIHKSFCKIAYPKNIKELIDILKQIQKNKLNVVSMGHGCSYGDQFINKKGIVINCKYLNKIKNFNNIDNTIIVEPGASISKVGEFLLKKKCILNNIPSYTEITIGGAISNNVHGKDSHINGFFCDNVRKITYIDSDLSVKVLSRKDNSIKFDQFIGSIGLLGIIIEVELNAVKIKSPYLAFQTYYLNNFDEFFQFYKTNDMSKIPYYTFKIDQFSRNKNFGSMCVNLYKWHNDDSDLNYKKINFSHILYKRKFSLISKLLFPVCALFSNRLSWKMINYLSFLFYKYFKDNKKKVIHIFDLLYKNYFTDHNLIFKHSGLYSLQVFIPIKIFYPMIVKLLTMAQESKNESYLSNIKFLPKRDDFIYEIKEHVAFEMYFIRNKKNNSQNLFIKKVLNLIIKNQCQLNIAKDNLMDSNYCEKIFPKVKQFRKLKHNLDKNSFFSSSYFERVIK